MADTSYEYTISPVDIERLEREIAASPITVALKTISLYEAATLIVFKAELSLEDKSLLDGVVASHTGEPLPLENPVVDLATPKDKEGKPIFVRSMTTTNWHYSSHALDYYTAKHDSLYNRECDGFTVESTSDSGDAGMRFYDADGVELTQNYEEDDESFQARLTANCTKTCVWFEKYEDYDIAGAHFYVESKPASRAYLWVLAAPDIPVEAGGRVSFMGRGMNMQMMAPGAPHTFFAESCVRIKYDPVYHSGRICAEILHAPGEQIGVQIIFIVYEE
jgi:hypothetical protein